MVQPPMTVSVRSVRPVLGGLLASGHDADAALAAVGLDAAVVADSDARVPHDQAAALWDEAVRRTGNAGFGLFVAQSMDLTGFDVFSYIFLGAPSPGESYRRMCR